MVRHGYSGVQQGSVQSGAVNSHQTCQMRHAISSDVRIFEISNRIVTSVFDSIRVQIFEIFEYLPSPIFYLFKQNGADFSPKNHA